MRKIPTVFDDAKLVADTMEPALRAHQPEVMRALTAIGAYDTAVLKINKRPDSDGGREARKAAAQEAYDTLNGLKEKWHEAAEPNIERARRELFTVEEPKRGTEVRAAYAKLDETQVRAALMTGVDDETFYSLAAAPARVSVDPGGMPRSSPLVPPDLLEAGLRQRRPEAGTRLDTFVQRRDALLGLVNQLKNVLGTHAEVRGEAPDEHVWSRR